MKQKIVIIGAGEIGKAIGNILSKEDLTVRFWNRDPSKVPGQKPLEETVAAADFLFLCIPSWAVRSILGKVKPYLAPRTIVVSLAKGLESKTLKSMDKVLLEKLPVGHPFALLAGPMLAEELNQGLPAVGILACYKKKIFLKTALIFEGSSLKLRYSSDVPGVAFSGVLKNIYTLSLGAADGLSLGSNFKAFLLQKAVWEMGEIVKILGGQKNTAYGLSGLADLTATGYSSYSRNRLAGEKLVKSPGAFLKSEGMLSLPSIFTLLGERTNRFDLLEALRWIIIQKKDPRKILTGLNL